MSLIRHLFGTLFRHRALLWQFTLRTVELRSKGSHLGLAWSVLSPLVMLALYVLVFGYIFGGSFGRVPNETHADYGLGIFLGLALFNFAGDMLCNSAMLITDNTNYVKKVVFPLEILPVAAVGSALIHLIITFGLVVLGICFFGRGLSLTALYLPVVLLPVVMGALGIAWFLAALGVFLQDLRQILPAATTALMFASAVFYAPNRIPATAYSFLKYNPLLHAIENARAVVLWDGGLDLTGMVYLYVCAMASLLGGYWTFQKLKPAFADVL